MEFKEYNGCKFYHTGSTFVYDDTKFYENERTKEVKHFVITKNYSKYLLEKEIYNLEHEIYLLNKYLSREKLKEGFDERDYSIEIDRLLYLINNCEKLKRKLKGV